MAREPLRRFIRSRGLINRALPKVGEMGERNVAVGGGIQKNDVSMPRSKFV